MYCVTLTVMKNFSDDKASLVVSQLIESLAEHPIQAGGVAADFQSIGPRQVQGWFESANEVVGFILSAARSGTWGVCLSLVPEDQANQLDWSKDTGAPLDLPAHSRGSLDATRAPGGVRLMILQSGLLVDSKTAQPLGSVEAGLQLLCSIERRRSNEGQEAGLMINAGYSQTATADQLRVSQQAVSSRLQAGYWYESRRVAYWLAKQLEDLFKL